MMLPAMFTPPPRAVIRAGLAARLRIDPREISVTNDIATLQTCIYFRTTKSIGRYPYEHFRDISTALDRLADDARRVGIGK